MAEFRSLGHVGEAGDMRITLTGDGDAMIESLSSGWEKRFSADVFREVTELFAAAAALLPKPEQDHSMLGWDIGQELSTADLEALPTGAVVHDGDNSYEPRSDRWEKGFSDVWVNQAEAMSDRTSSQMSLFPTVTLVSLP